MELYTAQDLDVYEVVDLGQAIGTAYGPASLLLTGRDGLHVSRMAKRGLILGIAYTGASVLDLRLTPKLVLDDHLGRQGDGALYVDYRPSRIRITLDGEGAEERAEEIYRRLESKDFLRAPLSDLGAISLYPNAIDDYVSGIHKRVDFLKSHRVLVDCQNAPVAVLMGPLMESYGMRVDLFNDRVTHYQEPRGEEEFLERFRRGRYNLGIRCLEGRFDVHRPDGDRLAYPDVEALLRALEAL
jgi:phosphomannomutase